MNVHIGCGTRYIPGFTHIDVVRREHVDYVSPAHDLPLPDSSVDLVYASHILEYYDLYEASDCLDEWMRVLKPGGIVRIAVPNFDALIEVYRQTQDLSRIIGPLYGRMPGSEGYIYHRTTFNMGALSNLLASRGFIEVTNWDWKNVEHSEIDDCSQAYFPHMQKETGLLVSLNVQARKPAE